MIELETCQMNLASTESKRKGCVDYVENPWRSTEAIIIYVASAIALTLAVKK